MTDLPQDVLPKGVTKLLRQHLASNELVIARCVGDGKTAVVLTMQRLLIVKVRTNIWGPSTGVYSYPYTEISGAAVRFWLGTGVFSILTKSSPTPEENAFKAIRSRRALPFSALAISKERLQPESFRNDELNKFEVVAEKVNAVVKAASAGLPE